MAVTSQAKPAGLFGEVPVADWEKAGLLKPSVIKPVVASIEKSLVIRKLGRLEESRSEETPRCAGIHPRLSPPNRHVSGTPADFFYTEGGSQELDPVFSSFFVGRSRAGQASLALCYSGLSPTPNIIKGKVHHEGEL